LGSLNFYNNYKPILMNLKTFFSYVIFLQKAILGLSKTSRCKAFTRRRLNKLFNINKSINVSN